MKGMKSIALFLVLVCAFASTVAVGAADAKPTEIAYGHGFMPTTPQHKSAIRFKELVEERSKGSIKVNVFPSGQLGSAKDMFESLQMGTQQVALLPTARISGFAPRLQLFDLPFLFPSREIAYRIFDGPIGAELLKSLDEKGVKGVAIYAVFEQTPAAAAGLEGLGVNRLGDLVFGDVITAVDQLPVRTIEDLQAILDPRKPGERVTLTVARAGQTRDLVLPLVEEN